MNFIFVGNETVGAMVEQRLEDAGHKLVEDISSAQLVVSYCTNQMALEDAYFEDEGVIKNAVAGALVVDLSPTTPSFARELAAVCMASDLLVVDAPMMVMDPSASDAFVERDNTTCFVSGDEEAKKVAAPVLEVLFSSVLDMGETGAACMARCAYTIQSVSAMVAAVEAEALYRAVRMMPAGLGQAAAGRAGALSPATDALLTAVEEGRFDGPYTVEMLMGEVAAALSTAEDAEVALPQMEGAMQLLEMLAIIGGAGKQPAAMALAYREPSEVEEYGLNWNRLESMMEGGQAQFQIHDEIGGFDMDDDADYGFEDDDTGYEFARERVEEYADPDDDYDYDESTGPVSTGRIQQVRSDDYDYGFEDDDPGYDFASERIEEYADFEDDDFID